MRDAERSRGAMVTAIVSIVLLAATLALPWFTYDFSSGRQTAPDGPFGDDPMTETSEMDYYAFRIEGDTEPTDPDAAEAAMITVGGLVLVGMALLLVVVLGELRSMRRIISRRTAIAFTLLAFGASASALAVVWWWVPQTLSGYGVEDAFTHRLDEPEGYTRTGVGISWVIAAVSLASSISATLFTFQSGSHDPALVEVYRSEA